MVAKALNMNSLNQLSEVTALVIRYRYRYRCASAVNGAHQW